MRRLLAAILLSLTSVISWAQVADDVVSLDTNSWQQVFRRDDFPAFFVAKKVSIKK